MPPIGIVRVDHELNVRMDPELFGNLLRHGGR
jgi:hypothetical protein